jgi:hypothetical protein
MESGRDIAIMEPAITETESQSTRLADHLSTLRAKHEQLPADWEATSESL